MKNVCEYCMMPGKHRGDDDWVCDQCWSLLQNPETALPLIRGHLTIMLRGKIPESELKQRIDAFMETISAMKKPVIN